MNQRRKYLPILMYHGIWSAAETSQPHTSSNEHAVEARDFRAQLDTIIECGYRTSTLDELDRPARPAKAVLITFDDGNDSDLMVAAPELARRNLHAIFFVIWSYLGRPGYLTRGQVLELRKQGFEIGSHGLSHSRLSQMSAEDASREVLESKQKLEDLLQEPITGLAIPFGRYNDAVIAAARSCGYRRIMTSDFRIANREQRVMPRLGPMADTTLADFKWMLQASRVGAFRHHAIEAIGVRMRRLANYGEALLWHAPNAEVLAKPDKRSAQIIKETNA